MGPHARISHAMALCARANGLLAVLWPKAYGLRPIYCCPWPQGPMGLGQLRWPGGHGPAICLIVIWILWIRLNIVTAKCLGIITTRVKLSIAHFARSTGLIIKQHRSLLKVRSLHFKVRSFKKKVTSLTSFSSFAPFKSNIAHFARST